MQSGRALEVLLERHQFFSLLLSAIKIQGLAQLKTKLCDMNSESVVREPSVDDPLPDGSRSCRMNSYDGDHREDGSQCLYGVYTGHQHKGTKSITAACVDFCDPYVISGWCKLVNTLMQTFPNLIATYVHNYCIVASLTRQVSYLAASS